MRESIETVLFIIGILFLMFFTSCSPSVLETMEQECVQCQMVIERTMESVCAGDSLYFTINGSNPLEIVCNTKVGRTLFHSEYITGRCDGCPPDNEKVVTYEIKAWRVCERLSESIKIQISK